ncbi:MAG: methylmalonate-semialdehyde dehydrogenase [Armatimonadetes bacterium CSP1-3]|nr:MAG: methylmalonate-semialdehyde dehydrogenase [Armatimonadetes bacterium CSP1-3]
MGARSVKPQVEVLQNFIGGAWVPSKTERVEDIPNPATGDLLARVPYSTVGDVEAAVAAAARAYPAWRDTPVVERARVMFRFRQVLEDHLEELALLVTQENGKTVEEARGEVRRGIEVVEFACGMPTLMMGNVVEDTARGIDSELIRVPLGVVVGICPFNFPAMIPLWMFPIALTAGNAFVLKPSERTPLSAVRFADLLTEAGLPAGVLNLVHGVKEAVDALLAHPAVKAVSFVGSAPVAQYIYQTAAAHGKRVQALAGAKNHLIVMPDADLERTVPAIISSAFGNAGERCLAGSVVVAVGDVADRFVPLLAAAAAKLRVGVGWDSATEMGPVIRPNHRRRILDFIERGTQEGAHLVCDGRAQVPRDETGFFVGATVFDHVRPEMTIAQEEIFGPVLGVIRVATLDEALQVVNRSRYGNMACIFTASGKAAREFRVRVEAGMLGINIGVAAPIAFFPFTGWKGSFYGDLHATGKDAVEFYTEKKVVTSRWF